MVTLQDKIKRLQQLEGELTLVDRDKTNTETAMDAVKEILESKYGTSNLVELQIKGDEMKVQAESLTDSVISMMDSISEEFGDTF